jgi:hypothetical protein
VIESTDSASGTLGQSIEGRVMPKTSIFFFSLLSLN